MDKGFEKCGVSFSPEDFDFSKPILVNLYKIINKSQSLIYIKVHIGGFYENERCYPQVVDFVYMHGLSMQNTHLI